MYGVEHYILADNREWQPLFSVTDVADFEEIMSAVYIAYPEAAGVVGYIPVYKSRIRGLQDAHCSIWQRTAAAVGHHAGDIVCHGCNGGHNPKQKQ